MAKRFRQKWKRPNYKRDGVLERSILLVKKKEITISFAHLTDQFPVCYGVKKEWDKKKKDFMRVDSGFYFRKWKKWEKISGRAIQEQVPEFIPENIEIHRFLYSEVKKVYEENFLPKREQCKKTEE